MEYEIRFYFSKDKYDHFIKILNDIDGLNFKGKRYEKTSQYNHPSKEYDFYSKNIDGRFRIRKTILKDNSICKISWKRRLIDTIDDKYNKEEEIEVNIDSKDYDNLINILKNVIHMDEVESYERYRTVYENDEIEIGLDEYPFGLALEIEAKDNTPEVIDKYIKLLGLDYNDSYRLSWDDKYEELCKEQNKEKYNHVLFDKDMPEIK